MTCWAEKWRDKVLEAFDAGDLDKLNQLAAVSVRNSPSAIDLLCGAGFLPQEASIWRDCSEQARRLVELALRKWKDEKGPSPRIAAPPVHPLGLLRAGGFQAAACHFEEVLLALDGPYRSERLSKVAARLLALRSFENIRELEGLSSCYLAGWSSVCDAQAVLERLGRRTNEHGMVVNSTQTPEVTVTLRKTSAAASSSTEPANTNTLSDITTTMDASKDIEFMTQSSCEERWDQRKVESKRRKFDDLGFKLTPEQAITALTKSQESGELLPLLDQMVVDARREVRGKSLKSAASGLRAEQSYSVPVLGYPEAATLPPRSSRDVQRYVMIFSNPNTAANYLSYLVYARKLCEVSIA